MAKSKIVDIVEELAQPIAEKNNCEIVDVEFKKEGANWFLRIFIDKDEGITIDDCEAVSKEISDKLDEVDPIEQSYFLEVSSPGINRPLKKDKDFLKFLDHKIEIKLYEAMNGTKLLRGVLESYHDGIITIKLEEGNIVEIAKEKAAQVILADDLDM
ncbi:MAG: ribosome maturation factor RimP [Clostridiales bacterium]|jgi:ribosome maturation factor RimP|nr:ribosome maturation factor RimP [Clostridiales bacterium]MDK2932328.1 ribosome maturation factor RimP [Clostridiales bacterium]